MREFVPTAKQNCTTTPSGNNNNALMELSKTNSTGNDHDNNLVQDISSSQPTACSSNSNCSICSSEHNWKSDTNFTDSKEKDTLKKVAAVKVNKKIQNCRIQNVSALNVSYKDVLLLNSKLNTSIDISQVSDGVNEVSNPKHTNVACLKPTIKNILHLDSSDFDRKYRNLNSTESSNFNFIVDNKSAQLVSTNEAGPIINWEDSKKKNICRIVKNGKKRLTKKLLCINGSIAHANSSFRESFKRGKSNKLSGSRIDTSIVRESIAQAVSQGVVTKSARRGLKQCLLRGETLSIMDSLRRYCHLQPVVSSISYQTPTKYDLRNTNGLMKCVNLLSPCQHSDGLAKKHIVLVEIERIIDAWIADEYAIEHKLNSINLKSTPNACTYVGGSWHLKIDSSDSDLDIVALVPKWITTTQFFSNLKSFLEKRAEVHNLLSMDEASVPRMSFCFNSVQIDLLLSRFTQNTVPKNLPIHSDHILSGMDIGSIRSLSGPRVASIILELVPNPNYFRSCIRSVRLWAKRRSLYSNKLGFLGGISWTILTAFICQMFPNATPSMLFHQFFIVYSTWKWPTPIMLAKPYDAGFNVPQWSPQEHLHEKSHVMPIITPSYPAMNSSVNVNSSTLCILQEEFTRGKMVIDNMMNKNLSSPIVWRSLFEYSDFNVRYDYYLSINLSGAIKDSTCLEKWTSYIESRIRKLIETLQHTRYIRAAHPYPHVTKCYRKSEVINSFYIGLDFFPLPPLINGEIASTYNIVKPVINYFQATEINHNAHYIDNLNSEILYKEWQDLPDDLFRNGKQHAAGYRAKFKLSRAHNLHMAQNFGSNYI